MREYCGVVISSAKNESTLYKFYLFFNKKVLKQLKWENNKHGKLFSLNSVQILLLILNNLIKENILNFISISSIHNLANYLLENQNFLIEC